MLELYHKRKKSENDVNVDNLKNRTYKKKSN